MNPQLWVVTVDHIGGGRWIYGVFASPGRASGWAFSRYGESSTGRWHVVPLRTGGTR